MLTAKPIITSKTLADETTYVGIDPGVTGCIVSLRPHDVPRVYAIDTIEKLWTSVKHGLDISPIRICVEKVGGFIGTRPGGGVHKNIASGHTMFKFGTNYGAILMAIEATGCSNVTTHVLPQQWHKKCGIRSKFSGESQTSYKNHIRDIAQRIFSPETIHVKNADAFMLAHYCRLIHGVV